MQYNLAELISHKIVYCYVSNYLVIFHKNRRKNWKNIFMFRSKIFEWCPKNLVITICMSDNKAI